MIIWRLTETPSEYVYTLRSRLIFIISVILIVGTFFYGLKYQPNSQTYFYGWVVLLVIFIIDLLPMGFRQLIARIKGRAVQKSGNLFIGNPTIEIQK